MPESGSCQNFPDHGRAVAVGEILLGNLVGDRHQPLLEGEEMAGVHGVDIDGLEIDAHPRHQLFRDAQAAVGGMVRQVLQVLGDALHLEGHRAGIVRIEDHQVEGAEGLPLAHGLDRRVLEDADGGATDHVGALEQEPGERLLTSGDGGIFPPGIPVGVVTDASGGTILVQPLVDWSRLEYISVVDYAF